MTWLLIIAVPFWVFAWTAAFTAQIKWWFEGQGRNFLGKQPWWALPGYAATSFAIIGLAIGPLVFLIMHVLAKATGAQS